MTRAIAGGADGYLLKDSGKDAILGAIDRIMGGQNVIDSRVMKRLAALVSARGGQDMWDANAPDFLSGMTQREKEI